MVSCLLCWEACEQVGHWYSTGKEYLSTYFFWHVLFLHAIYTSLQTMGPYTIHLLCYQHGDVLNKVSTALSCTPCLSIIYFWILFYLWMPQSNSMYLVTFMIRPLVSGDWNGLSLQSCGEALFILLSDSTNRQRQQRGHTGAGGETGFYCSRELQVIFKDLNGAYVEILLTLVNCLYQKSDIFIIFYVSLINVDHKLLFVYHLNW